VCKTGYLLSVLLKLNHIFSRGPFARWKFVSVKHKTIVWWELIQCFGWMCVDEFSCLLMSSLSVDLLATPQLLIICHWLSLLPLMWCIDYNFVTRDEMTRAIANNEFVEHAEFSGNFYGTRSVAEYYWLCEMLKLTILSGDVVISVAICMLFWWLPSEPGNPPSEGTPSPEGSLFRAV